MVLPVILPLLTLMALDDAGRVAWRPARGQQLAQPLGGERLGQDPGDLKPAFLCPARGGFEDPAAKPAGDDHRGAGAAMRHLFEKGDPINPRQFEIKHHMGRRPAFEVHQEISRQSGGADVEALRMSDGGDG